MPSGHCAMPDIVFPSTAWTRRKFGWPFKRGGDHLVRQSLQSRCRCDWGAEVVAIPDIPATLEGLEETIRILDTAAVPFRIDPVLEPIGFGFAHSLGRFLDVRRRYPSAAMLMGIGNLTELTDVDSSGINVLLLGMCQELDIQSVLTTQVINWPGQAFASVTLPGASSITRSRNGFCQNMSSHGWWYSRCRRRRAFSQGT